MGGAPDAGACGAACGIVGAAATGAWGVAEGAAGAAGALAAGEGDPGALSNSDITAPALGDAARTREGVVDTDVYDQ